MKNLLRILVYVPLGLAFLYFAMANRGFVRIGVDPFAAVGDTTAAAFEAPLFLVVILAFGIGVVVGGFSSWLSHADLRRHSKVARAEVKKAQSEISQLRQQALNSIPRDDGKTPPRLGGS